MPKKGCKIMTMILETKPQYEFEFVKPFLAGKGIDVGCGTSRISKKILAIDAFDHRGATFHTQEERDNGQDVVHDCRDLEIAPVDFDGIHYDFNDGELDFIFSSHCLEDFEDIPTVFAAWWKKIKADGLMILLLPDMQGGRYPDLALHRATGQGNPSHKTDVGKAFMLDMLARLGYKHEMIQMDTIPHDRSCTIDFVIKKKE